jgi:hypothetical protein
MSEFIDDEIERAGLSISAQAGQWVRDKLAEAGISQEEIDHIMHEAVKDVIVSAVCPYCQGYKLTRKPCPCCER